MAVGLHHLKSGQFPANRDLRLPKQFDISKNLREAEEIIPVIKHESYVIDDMASAKMQILDSLIKLYKVSGLIIDQDEGAK